MLNGWYVRDNTFTKGFMNYVVRVFDTQVPNSTAPINVQFWRGEGYEDTMKTFAFRTFEEAFDFVEKTAGEFVFFDDLLKRGFKCG